MKVLDQLLQHFERIGPVVLLESQSKNHPESKTSYLAGKPSVIIKGLGNRITVQKEGIQEQIESNAWDFLSDFIAKNSDWLFGYFGYDLKNSLEDLSSKNEDPVRAPDFFFMVPEFLAEIDRQGQVQNIIKGQLPEGSDTEISQGKLKISDLKSSVSSEEHIGNIKKAQYQIAEGDFYEVNLSHQQSDHFSGSPYALYQKMCAVGPVPFGAYLSFEDFSICSLSPERFLKKEGEKVFSQPIKGTIKRGKTDEQDLKLKKRLQNSAKERAENLMIVDLVRNDLSRIGKSESVKVSDLFQVQTFGTVHQMVSTISAECAVDDPIEIIKACYPMGSMTGAPKISAMKAIEKLENYKRGIYSGAIGYIKPNKDFDFNVVIRTAIIKNDRLYYSVGGAITGDSDPVEEWEETLVKAKALTEI